MAGQNSPYRDGWGVLILPMWEDNEDRIVDIETVVIRLSPATEAPEFPGMFKPWEDSRFFVPGSFFVHCDDLTQDDTHDLRDRWFATEGEARSYEKYTRERWTNPQPWESFIRT